MRGASGLFHRFLMLASIDFVWLIIPVVRPYGDIVYEVVDLLEAYLAFFQAGDDHPIVKHPRIKEKVQWQLLLLELEF